MRPRFWPWAPASGAGPTCPAGTAARVIDAVAFLHGMEGEDPPQIGRRVVVYGGGDTAVDAARTARRLGAEPVIVYRRTRDRAPAQDLDVEEALEEGVLARWLSTIQHIDAGAVTVERMVLDDAGFPQPTGETETLAADTVILALGQECDLSLVEGVADITVIDGVVQVGPDMMTGHPGIFAGGDMVPAERTVTTAVGHGRLAARHIDAWLRGQSYTSAPRPPEATFRAAQHRGTTRTHRGRSVRELEAARRASTLRRGRRRARRVDRPVRGAPVPVMRELLRVRQLLRRLPGQRGDQAGAGCRLPLRPGVLQGLRDLRPGMPVRGDRDAPRADLMHELPGVPGPAEGGSAGRVSVSGKACVAAHAPASMTPAMISPVRMTSPAIMRPTISTVRL